MDRAGYSGNSTAGEAPGWFVRLYDERPGRRADRLLLYRLASGDADAENVVFFRYGNRKPHTYYW
ncbi:hypothetical protein M0638_24965 [Roseomonas sp. NAR14]|uniref:Uncharacterized protein n=1 Tax=Roseomonas acroporae TaxID=2937791 RepID=A0A9X1YFC1_9PROT|nr:hypothetical protein [Roseomonas acroporae]MCK8787622.1 hypothetical protein [Roseomonas acroporae]